MKFAIDVIKKTKQLLLKTKQNKNTSAINEKIIRLLGN